MVGEAAPPENCPTKRTPGVVMLTHKLINLIQYHSENLAASLLNQVQMSERSGSYRSVPPAELKEVVYEIYHKLGTWLLHKTDIDIEQRYLAIGARRVEQNVALNELVWVIVLTKRNLWRFIDDVSFPGRAADNTEKQEMVLLLDQFFDEAIHAAIVGYESAAQKKSRSTQPSSRLETKMQEAS
jgi:hypothetical protein